MLLSVQNYQSKMTAQNMKSALAFAAFSFLLVLIATFGVVYRYDLHPWYGTFVHIGPYYSPKIPTTVKSQISIENISGLEQGKMPPAAVTSKSTKEDPNKSDSDFFDKIVAVFASVKSRPSDSSKAASSDLAKPCNEVPITTKDHVRFPGAVQTPHNIREFTRKEAGHPILIADESKATIPEILYEEKISKSSETARPNTNSFYDRLIEMASRHLAENSTQIRSKNEQGETHTYEVQIPLSEGRGQNQIFPPWVEEMLEGSSETKVEPRTISGVFPGLENLLDDLDGEFQSESFEVPEFPFSDLLDDSGTSLDVTEESDSEEDFFFGRNPKHFVQPERLPEFLHPAIDFPMNRNFRV